MKILVERGWGEIFANFTRQALLTKLDVWRPVAFAIGASSNIVTAGDNVIEDSVELASKLSSYHFDIQIQEPGVYRFKLYRNAVVCSGHF